MTQSVRLINSLASFLLFYQYIKGQKVINQPVALVALIKGMLSANEYLYIFFTNNVYNIVLVLLESRLSQISAFPHVGKGLQHGGQFS